MIAELNRVVLGPPLDRDTQIGPLVSRVQMIAGNSWINAHNVFAYGLPYRAVNLSGLGGGVNSFETLLDYLRPQTIARPLGPGITTAISRLVPRRRAKDQPRIAANRISLLFPFTRHYTYQ